MLVLFDVGVICVVFFVKRKCDCNIYVVVNEILMFYCYVNVWIWFVC